MLDNSNLKEPPNVSPAIEAELSSFMSRGSSIFSSAPKRRTLPINDRRLPEPRIEDAPEMAEQTRPDTTADTSRSVEDLLTQRQSTHGEFSDNARVSQSIKRIMRAEPGWELLTDTEREAMDMIALKISRLLSGKALELQHWEDIVGYARLAEKLCKGV